jgi:hypothetical protein
MMGSCHAAFICASVAIAVHSDRMHIVKILNLASGRLLKSMEMQLDDAR